MKRTEIARLLGIKIKRAYVEGFENLDTDALTELFRQLCRLNAMAFKDYRELTRQQEERNRVVYEVKNNVLDSLSDALYEAGAAVAYWNGAVYVRNSNGVQMSLHVYGGGWDIYDYPYRKEIHWDGVFDAWRYNNSSLKIRHSAKQPCAASTRVL